MKMLLNALLEEGIRCVSGSSPSNKLNRGASKVTTSTTTECQENDTEREQHFDKGLNAEQCAAVKLCTEDCESPVVLIHGPFGTGKTRTLVISLPTILLPKQISQKQVFIECRVLHRVALLI